MNGADNQPKFTVNADDMEILRLAKMQIAQNIPVYQPPQPDLNQPPAG